MLQVSLKFTRVVGNVITYKYRSVYEIKLKDNSVIFDIIFIDQYIYLLFHYRLASFKQMNNYIHIEMLFFFSLLFISFSEKNYTWCLYTCVGYICTTKIVSNQSVFRSFY